MRVMWVVLLLWSGCFAYSPIVRFGSGKSSKQVQREEFTNATPPALVALDKWSGSITDVKIRVWADDDYRAQNRRWQKSFDGQLSDANEVLGPMLGIRMVADYRDWSHRARVDSTLDDIVEVLRTRDPGVDVFVVVGLTSALSLVSPAFDKLGVAELGGRHLVVRGYADGEERAQFVRAFPDISTEEREVLHDLRRRHKTVSVLLHEIGHILGAHHDSDADMIMSPNYSVRAAAFSASSRARMLVAADNRLGRERSSARDAVAHPSLVVAIDESGGRFVGGVPVTDATLDELLRLSFADDRETEVVIEAHPKAPPDTIRVMIERARAAGLTRVTVARP